MAKTNLRARFRDPVVVRSAKSGGLPRTAAIADTAQRNDHFIVRNGVRCAGAHLIVDLYEAERLDDVDHIEATLRRCV